MFLNMIEFFNWIMCVREFYVVCELFVLVLLLVNLMWKFFYYFCEVSFYVFLRVGMFLDELNLYIIFSRFFI